jgi:Ca2+:H+ antiporter
MEIDIPNQNTQSILNTPNTPNTKNVHFDSKGKDAEIEELQEKDTLSNTEEDKLNSEENTNSSGEELENLEGDIEEEEEEEEEVEDGEINENDEFQNVKDRQEAINVSHPFGLRLWKPALYKKHRSIFTTTHEALHSQPNQPYTKAEIFLFPGNLIWAITFGWIAALTYLFVAVCLLVPIYIVIYIFETLIKPPQAISLSPKPKQSALLARYIRLLFGITHYIFWPFGKYIERVRGNFSEDIDYYTAINEEDNDRYKNFFNDADNEIVGNYSRKRSEHFAHKYGTEEEIEWNVKKLLELLFNNGVSGFFFYLFMYTIITPMHLIVAAICWMFVVSIPMSKLNFVLLNHILNEPLELFVHSSNPPPFQINTIFKKIHKNENAGDESVLPLINTHGDSSSSYPATTPQSVDFNSTYQVSGHSEIILCTYRAIGLRYYKYTLGGINVIFFNSLLFVVFTLLDAYLISPKTGKTGVGHPLVIFFSSLISVIPLAYFIGMSVSSITAQTNLALGAVINATFGSIIEVILYTIALAEGKAKIVEGSIIGSVLTGILALPGMSMLTGGIKRKEQRFNAKSAGVSSTLLILSIIGIFTPTLFQKFYGSYNLECESCPDNLGTSFNSTLTDPTTIMSECRNCRLRQPDPLDDPFYHTHTKYLVWICAVALVFTYGVGLLFTLRTHVKQIYAKTKKNNQKRRSRSRTRRSSRSRSRNNKKHSSNSSEINTPSGSSRSVNPLGSTSATATSNNVSLRDDDDDDIIYNSYGEIINKESNMKYEFNNLINSVDRDRDRDRDHERSRDRNRDRDHNSNLTKSKPFTILNIQTTEEPVNLPLREKRRSSKNRNDNASVISYESDSDSEGEKEEEEVGHEAPSWTKLESVVVLLVSTIIFSLLAEILIGSVDVVLKSINLDEKFLGVTLFALAPNVSEFYNAIAFAMYGNIALSLEIGSAYATQVAMLQIPAIIVICSVRHFFMDIPQQSKYMFTLIFSKWDVVTIIIGVFLLSHVYAEGKSNYFKGAMLLMAYLDFVISYYFII